mgnify:CR=1 FL=1
MVIHIVHSGEPVGTGSNLSDAQILAQIDEFNKDNKTFIEKYDLTKSL